MKLQPAKATICNSQRVTSTFAAFALTLYSDKHFSLPEIMSECVLSSMECKLQLLLQTLAASLFLDAERCKEQKLCRLYSLLVFIYLVLTLASSSKGRCRAERPLQKFSIRSRAASTPNSKGEVSTSRLIEKCWTNWNEVLESKCGWIVKQLPEE